MEREDPIDERLPAMMEFPEEADGLHPPKRLLHEFAFPLTDFITGMPRGARTDGAAPVRGLWKLRHVR